MRSSHGVFMHNLLILARWLAAPCHFFARLAGLLLLVLTAVIIYDVVGRKFFATGSFKLQELEWHLHGAIAMFGLGYAYLKNAHVRIDVLAARMSERFKLWLELFAIVLFLIPFMFLLLDFGYDFAERAFIRGETSIGGLGLSHRWIIKSVVPISALLTLLAGMAVALRIVVALFRPDLSNSPFEAP